MRNTQKRNQTGGRYVFICGLHRSGTSLLGRNIARMENCTGFKDTGVIEDEGQFLQDVYPTAMTYGGAGKFGFDSRAHLTETSVLFTPANAARLRASWHAYWDNSKIIFVEKTPGNLLKTRFLQAVFPDSYFIVIRRHPLAVSMANQKWKVSLAPLHNLFDHWLHCHAIFEADKKYLKHVYELSYEDYVRDPDKYHQEIATFIGTKVPESSMEQVTSLHNERYFNRWSDLLNNSAFTGYYRFLAVEYEPKFTNYGYSLTKGFDINEERFREGERISAAAGALYRLLADAYALRVRLTARSKGYIRNQLRTHLPGPLKVRIQRLLQ
jgi:Sulfotransferase family